MARTRRRKRPQGWLPKQHGAWFMLSLPVITGVILRGRDAALAWYLLPLAACWVVGYLAFNAATVWLRSAPARRHAQRPRCWSTRAFRWCSGCSPWPSRASRC